jgi:hypothetical protein
MPATFDDTLGIDKDNVRFMNGDVDTTNPLLQDEEINGLLAHHDNNLPHVIGWALRSILVDPDKMALLRHRSYGTLDMSSIMQQYATRANEWLGS